MNEILITVIHPTARTKPTPAFPEGWREAARTAYERADNPERIQYLLAVHQSRIDDVKGSRRDAGGWSDFTVIQNDMRDCGVDQVRACKDEVRGKLVVILHDDMFPPQGWDTLLLLELEKWAYPGESLAQSLDRDAVVHVSSGVLTADGWHFPERNNELYNPQIFTMARVNRLGYMGWPEYESMFSDDEFSEHARLDGVVIDARHIIIFEHRHPIFGEMIDDVYRAENAIDAYKLGYQIFQRRRAAGFPGLESLNNAASPVAAGRRVFGCCLPGEHFSCAWVLSWTVLFGRMLSSWDVHVRMGYSTSVHVSRMTLAGQMLELSPKPEFVLWLDDDNLLSLDQFNMLVADLEAAEKEDPNIQMVVGWCWMKCESLDSERRVSCGRMSKNGKNHEGIVYESMMAGPHELIEIEWSGFPVVLMRPKAIERAGGPGAFLPYIDPDSPFGFLSEDQAFCRRYRESGGRMLVDRRIKVPHLKLLPAEPRGAGAEGAVMSSVERIVV